MVATTLPAVVRVVDLPTGTTVTGAELIEAVQTSAGVGQSVQLSLNQIATSLGIPAGGATGTILNKSSGSNYSTQFSAINTFVNVGTSLATTGVATSIVAFVANQGITSTQIANNAVGTNQIASSLGIASSLSIGTLLTVGGTATFNGGIVLSGTIGITGTTLITGTFGVVGTSQFTGAFNVAGTSIVTGNLGVIGTTLITGTFGQVGTSTMTGVFNVTGTTLFTSGTFGVVGTTLITGTFGQVGTSLMTGLFGVLGTTVHTGTFTVIGTSTFTGGFNFNVIGTTLITGSFGQIGTSLMTGQFGVSGTSLMTGSLGVIGPTTFTGTFSVIGTSNITGILSVTQILDISGASAGQIKFPATQNATTNINILDDYVEGTFTPTLFFANGSVSITYGAQTGVFTKIGNVVHFGLTLVLTSKGTSTGVVSISGLPYVVSASSDFIASMQTNLMSTSATTTIQGQINKGATTISPSKYAAGTNSNMTDADILNNSVFKCSGIYMV